MPTPSCRDALSREISDPVTDPFTGRCFRNPCAAEEAGVLDWVPGCVLAQPSYAEGDGGGIVDTWASEVWWNGGGGHRRRTRRPKRPGPGGSLRTGGQMGRPVGGRRISGGPGGAPLRSPAGGGGVPRRVGGGAPAGSGQLMRGPSSSLLRTGGNYAVSSKSALRPSLVATPMYTTGSKASSGPRYQAYGQASARMGSAGPRYTAAPSYGARSMTASAPRMSVSSGQRSAGPARSLKGLGLLMTVSELRDRIFGSYTPILLAIAGVALIPPVVVGGLVRWRTRSWSKAFAAGVAAVVVEGAIVGGHAERRRRVSRATAYTLPSIAYVR